MGNFLSCCKKRESHPEQQELVRFSLINEGSLERLQVVRYFSASCACSGSAEEIEERRFHFSGKDRRDLNKEARVESFVE